MRWVFVVLGCGLAGCQVVFPLELGTAKPNGCSPISMINGGFDDAGPVAAPWRVTDDSLEPNVSQGDGTLRIDAQIGTFYQIETQAFLELRDQRTTVHVQAAGELAESHVDYTLTSQELVNNRLFIRLEGRTTSTPGVFEKRLVAGHVDDTLDTNREFVVADVPYSDTDHQYLGFEQAGDTTRWLTSADGSRFDTLFETTGLQDWITYMQPRLIGGLNQQPLTIDFSEFNGGVPPKGTACPASTLSASFDLTEFPEWRKDEETCLITTGNGEMKMQFADNAPGSPHFCEFRGATLYNLRRGSITIDIAEFARTDGDDTELHFEVTTFGGKVAQMITNGDDIDGLFDSDTAGASAPFSTETRYWRVSASDDDTLTFETSPDNVHYTVFGNSAKGALGRLDAAVIAIYFEGGGGGLSFVRLATGVNVE